MANVKVNNTAIEFKPPTIAHVTKTVSTTAVSFSASEIPAGNGNYVYLQIQAQPVRATYYSGSTPTASVGELLSAGERATIKRDSLLAMKFIRGGDTDSVIFAQQVSL